MVMAISSGSEPLRPHGVWYEGEGIVRWIVTAILAGHGPHGASYRESGVASSGGHVVRSRRLSQTDGDSLSRGAWTCGGVRPKGKLGRSSAAEEFGRLKGMLGRSPVPEEIRPKRKLGRSSAPAGA
ncbi:hypothetical protein COCNU_03G005860 [Cocos nucifera]|uniref:Uncharacterized protein n=1 Tax=Cocos nucifera TaxID=13894 RepID=A0A8K0MY54_COCNU|nr:hypothetical protein COCNU_03G005860 [Cocos nucifera]